MAYSDHNWGAEMEIINKIYDYPFAVLIGVFIIMIIVGYFLELRHK